MLQIPSIKKRCGFRSGLKRRGEEIKKEENTIHRGVRVYVLETVTENWKFGAGDAQVEEVTGT
jgi:hypothetical protein